MPRVITLTDGKNETIFSAWDFEDLVDKYMGFDARNYLHELLDELATYQDSEETVEKLLEKVEELEAKLEKAEENHLRLEEEYEVYKQEHGE